MNQPFATHLNLFRQINVNVIQNLQQLIAGYLYRAVARLATVDYVKIGDEAKVFEIRVTEDAPLAGQTLTEAGKANLLPDDVLIVALGRESRDKPLPPRGSTRVEADDLLTVYSATGAEPELTDIFGQYEDLAV